jgi:hypothetical protein
MMGKLPKSETWKQSDSDRPGLLPHPRYSSRDYIGIHRILAELPHLSNLEPRNVCATSGQVLQKQTWQGVSGL